MTSDLFNHLHKIHTTELGVHRIQNNLGLGSEEVVSWCKIQIKKADYIIRKGKNYYVYIDDIVITVNAHSFTIITAHKLII